MALKDTTIQGAPITLEDAIYSRRTVRSFLPKPIPREVLEKVIKAGCASPSQFNSQPWHFTVVAGKERDDLVKIIRKFPVYLADILALFPEEITEAMALSEEYISSFAKNIGGAPAIIFISVPRKTNQYIHKVDIIACASAIQNMQLMAWSLGLGTVCLTSALWVEKELLSYLGFKDRELISIMPIGYREFDPEPTPRNDTNVTWLGF